MAPHIIKPADLSALLSTCDGAAGIDIGNGLSATLGCGRQTKYAQRWQWITDHGTGEGHYSDMVTLDGFGFYEICRRSGYDAKAKRYTILDHARGKLDKFTKRTADKVAADMLARVAGWFCFTTGGTECYKPTPWK